MSDKQANIVQEVWRLFPQKELPKSLFIEGNSYYDTEIAFARDVEKKGFKNLTERNFLDVLFSLPLLTNESFFFLLPDFTEFVFYKNNILIDFFYWHLERVLKEQGDTLCKEKIRCLQNVIDEAYRIEEETFKEENE